MSFVVGDTEVNSLGEAVELLSKPRTRRSHIRQPGIIDLTRRTKIQLAGAELPPTSLLPAIVPAPGDGKWPTSAKVALGVAALVVLYLLLKSSKKKSKAEDSPVHDTAEEV